MQLWMRPHHSTHKSTHQVNTHMHNTVRGTVRHSRGNGVREPNSQALAYTHTPTHVRISHSCTWCTVTMWSCASFRSIAQNHDSKLMPQYILISFHNHHPMGERVFSSWKQIKMHAICSFHHNYIECAQPNLGFELVRTVMRWQIACEYECEGRVWASSYWIIFT